MRYETILTQRHGAVRLVTLNRPQSLNAMNRRMVEELLHEFREAEIDESTRVLVVTGAPRPDGRPCFSAGADLKEGGDRRASPPGEPFRHTLDSAWEVVHGDGPRNASVFHVLFQTLETMRTPSIALLDGICTTGGLELALCADLRVSGSALQLSDWHVKNLGVIGGAGVTSRLPKVIGAARAKELMWTGEVISATEAHRIGLVNRVVESERAVEETLALAHTIAERSPIALAASKAVIDAASAQTTADSIRYAYLWSALIALEREITNAALPPLPLRANDRSD